MSQKTSEGLKATQSLLEFPYYCVSVRHGTNVSYIVNYKIHTKYVSVR